MDSLLFCWCSLTWNINSLSLCNYITWPAEYFQHYSFNSSFQQLHFFFPIQFHLPDFIIICYHAANIYTWIVQGNYSSWFHEFPGDLQPGCSDAEGTSQAKHCESELGACFQNMKNSPCTMKQLFICTAESLKEEGPGRGLPRTKRDVRRQTRFAVTWR